MAVPRQAAVEEHLPLEHQAVRRALAGFLLSGVLLSFLGAVLPAWQAHLTLDFTIVGKYFLGFSLGIVFGIRLARTLIAARAYTGTLVSACVLASAAFVFLIFVPPPSLALLRLAGLFVLGLAAAQLNAGLFHAVLPFYQRDRAATVNLAGALFGAGCLLTTLVVFLAFYVFNLSTALTVLALAAAGFAVLFARTKLSGGTPVGGASSAAPPRERLHDLKSPLALLVGVLLFFQIASEWSIAGWLPIFLIRRLGSSPAASLLMLACFWAALLAGRFVVQAILPRARHWRLLIGSVLVELMGYLLLTMTDNLFGALVGVLALAAGFALVYPLVARTIGNRLSANGQPDFFHGAFTFAFAGALVIPWLLGYLARAWGIGAVMILPFVGTVIVFVLLLVLMIEAFLSSSRSSA